MCVSEVGKRYLSPLLRYPSPLPRYSATPLNDSLTDKEVAKAVAMIKDVAE